jgi:hypothetical protein
MFCYHQGANVTFLGQLDLILGDLLGGSQKGRFKTDIPTYFTAFNMWILCFLFPKNVGKFRTFVRKMEQIPTTSD